MVRAMGLLDFLKRKSPLEKHGERAGNKRAQNADRWESIQALGKMATTEPAGGKPDERADAVAALMERFTFYVDPTITDGEEKDEAFRWICEAGEVAVDPVREALRRQDSLSWGMKCLEQLLPEDRFLEELITLLGTMDVEYERDPQRKQQLLSTLEERRHPGIAEAVEPFLQDVNEESRFHAYGAVMLQDDADDHRAAVDEALAEEESVRIKVRVLEMYGDKGWDVPEATALPDGWFRDKKGNVKKSTRQK